LQSSFGSPSGFDRTRNVEIGNKNIKLHHLEEAYTTSNWLVRIYRVKDLENREESHKRLRAIKHKRRYYPKKTSGKKRGIIRNKVAVTRGRRLRGGKPSHQKSTRRK